MHTITQFLDQRLANSIPLIATAETIAHLADNHAPPSGRPCTPEEATTILDAIIKEDQNTLIRRLWLSCNNPECLFPTAAEAIPTWPDPLNPHIPNTDPEGIQRASWQRCPACDHDLKDSKTTIVTYALALAQVKQIPTEQLLPGPDLDLLLATAQGMTPCTGWVESNFGSAGGPCLMSTRCNHTNGACWPTTTTPSMQGTIGGIPPYSTDRRRISLRDLPLQTQIERISPQEWNVHLPTGHVLTGRSEAHALTLALLQNITHGTSQPQWNDQNRWKSSWRATAQNLLALDPENLPHPWTPNLILTAGRLLQAEEEAARNVRATILEAKRPKEQRMMHRPFKGTSGSPDALEIHYAGIDLTTQTTEAHARGQAKAQAYFDARTQMLKREETPSLFNRVFKS